MFDESDEVNLHSQFIFSLLNLKTGTEYRYLNAFLKCVDSSFEYNLNSLEIHKELHDIDILLLDKSTKRAVIIENKIYASDSNHENEGQLEKYYRIIIEEEKIPEDNIEVYYLSLDGHEPFTEMFPQTTSIQSCARRSSASLIPMKSSDGCKDVCRLFMTSPFNEKQLYNTLN